MASTFLQLLCAAENIWFVLKDPALHLQNVLCHNDNHCSYALLGHRTLYSGGPHSMNQTKKPLCKSSSCYGGLIPSMQYRVGHWRIHIWPEGYSQDDLLSCWLVPQWKCLQRMNMALAVHIWNRLFCNKASLKIRCIYSNLERLLIADHNWLLQASGKWSLNPYSGYLYHQ